MATSEISVVTETLPESQVGLTIEVPGDRVDRAYSRVLDRLAQRVKVEGFRPGKAPRAMIEARLGPVALREEVIELLVPPVVADALRERGIEAVDRPQVEVRELDRGRPARFVARVSVWPEVTLPDLDTLRVERRHTEVGEDGVERRLLELRERLAELEPVEREVRTGDVVVGDLAVSAEGREIESERRPAMELEVREGVLIPELLAALPGKRVGEVATADALMPDDHSVEELRGRTARLAVTIQGVKEKRLPELTDDVAKELSGGDQETAEALREAVRADLREQARRLDELSFEQDVVKAVVEASQVDVPRALVEREVDRQLEDLEQRLGRRGLRLDRYLQYLDRSEADYRAELAPEAEGRIRADLVLDQVATVLGVEPSEEEVTAHLREEAAKDPETSGHEAELEANPVARGYFRHRLQRLQVLRALGARLGDDGETSGAAASLEKGAEAGAAAAAATDAKKATPQDEAD